jgi:multiple sugar transport system permease protein
MIGVGCFLLLPIVVVAWLSFYSWNLLGPMRFVGLDNWRAVLGDRQFGHALWVTLALTAIVVPVQTVLGFVVATPLADRRGAAAFRVVYALPWMCAPVAVGIVWQWLFAPTDGALNAVLGRHIAWLSDPALALPSVAAVSVWANFGYVALFFVAGLRAIPGDILEAGVLDGATGWRRTRWLVLPLLRPTLFFVLVTGVLTAFQTFDTVYALTKGGPGYRTDVVAMRMFSEAFDAARPGRAAVMAIVVFAVMFVITLAQHRYFRGRTTYEY